ASSSAPAPSRRPAPAESASPAPVRTLRPAEEAAARPAVRRFRPLHEERNVLGGVLAAAVVSVVVSAACGAIFRPR
ncbi:hypothetical protein, partial [Actinocorallia aurantiaca]|uniref:hypothetical protein n=1 Tax=Actinocorallia aurantiaca TaxID=46204 RepID=UPI0031DE8136